MPIEVTIFTPPHGRTSMHTITEIDVLTVYQTDVEHPPLDEIAVVLSNVDGHKISAILTKQDVERLHHQLGLYLTSVE